jgi:hypothetical protein
MLSIHTLGRIGVTKIASGAIAVEAAAVIPAADILTHVST